MNKVLIEAKNALFRSCDRYLKTLILHSCYIDLEQELLIVSPPLRGILVKFAEQDPFSAEYLRHWLVRTEEDAEDVYGQHSAKFHEILQQESPATTEGMLHLVRQLNLRTNVILETTFDPRCTTTQEGFQVTIGSTRMESSPSDFLFAYKLELKNLVNRPLPLRLVGISKEWRDATPKARRSQRMLSHPPIFRTALQRPWYDSSWVLMKTPYGDLRGNLFFEPTDTDSKKAEVPNNTTTSSNDTSFLPPLFSSLDLNSGKQEFDLESSRLLRVPFGPIGFYPSRIQHSIENDDQDHN